jgi:hypothetical protein
MGVWRSLDLRHDLFQLLHGSPLAHRCQQKTSSWPFHSVMDTKCWLESRVLPFSQCRIWTGCDQRIDPFGRIFPSLLFPTTKTKIPLAAPLLYLVADRYFAKRIRSNSELIKPNKWKKTKSSS